MSSMTTGARADATRPAKPLPTGMRTPLLDLLLQPARGAGDQHLLVLVEQEDRNGIHVQEVLDPQQVVDEQLVERAFCALNIFGRRSPRAGLRHPHPVLHAPDGIGALRRRLLARGQALEQVGRAL